MVGPSDASLEGLGEMEDLGLEILHPGGLKTTEDLASLCQIGTGTRVLDVACGTGESARFLNEQLHAAVVAVDRSGAMLRRAMAKVGRSDPGVVLARADAHELPFSSESFDAVICECTLSLLNKEQALSEMVRVARPGGYVGFHEICWSGSAPERIKEKLYALEGERAETLEGWKALLERFDVENVTAHDRSHVMSDWMKEMRHQLGLRGMIHMGERVLQRWGLRGLWRVLQSESIFESKHLGYGIVAGRKR